jgi:hypothetical protein
VTESGTQQGAVADHTGINSQGNNNSSSTGTAADGLGSSAEGAITTAAGGAALVRGPAGGDETVAEQHTSPGLQLGPQLRTSTTSEGAIGQSPDRSPGKAKKGIWGSITSLFRSSSSGSPAKAVDQGIQGPTSGHISAGGRTGSHNTGDEKEEEEQHALIGKKAPCFFIQQHIALASCFAPCGDTLYNSICFSSLRLVCNHCAACVYQSVTALCEHLMPSILPACR